MRLGSDLSINGLVSLTALLAGLGSVNGFSPALASAFSRNTTVDNGAATRFDALHQYDETTGLKTMVDSDGVLKWAPHNLLTYSEDFSEWGSDGSFAAPVVTDNFATSPDGTLTAAQVVFAETNAAIQISAACDADVQHTVSFWMRADTPTTVRVGGVASASYTTANVTSDWQLFSDTRPTNASTRFPQIRADEASTIEVWGAHLYRSDLGGMVNNPDRGDSYVPTAAQPIGPELITNGGFDERGDELVTNGTFDTDVSGWTSGNSATLTFDSGALLVTNTSANGFAVQGVTTEIDKIYVVTADVIAGSNNGRLGAGTAEGTPFNIGTTSFGSGEQTLTFTATGTTTYIGLQNEGASSGNTVSFDNVSVTEVLQGWTDRSTGTGTASFVNGELEIVRVDASNLGYLEQGVSTEIGKSYVVSATRVSGSGSGFRISTVAGGNDLYDQTLGSGTTAVTITATTTTTYVGFRGGDNASTTYIDNVTVRETTALPDAARYLARRNHHRWDGSAYVNKGLMLESEARTNLITYSEDFTDASWTLGRAVVALDAVGPDGVANSAATLTDNSATGSNTSYIDETFTVSTSTAYTFSIFAKADQLSDVHLRAIGFTTPAEGGVYFDLSAGAVGTEDTGYTGNIQNFGNGWYRCSLTFTTDAADTSGTVRVFIADGESLVVDLDGTSSILIYGAQFEAGSTPSSYMPTEGATFTRNAETLSILAADMPDYQTYTVVGPELVTNGGNPFTDTTDFVNTGGGTLEVIDGELVFERVSNSFVGYIEFSTEIGKVYEITATSRLVDGAATSIGWRVLSNAAASGANLGEVSGVTTQSTDTIYITASQTTSTFQATVAGGAGRSAFESISVQEVNPLAVSIAMKGEITYADNGAGTEASFYNWESDVSNYIEARLVTLSTLTGRVQFFQVDAGTTDSVSSANDAYSPNVNVPFSIASRHLENAINGAVDGTALTEDTTPTALPDLSAADFEIAPTFMGTIEYVYIWNEDIADAGLEEVTG
jgi:hypothetical protein